MVIVEVGDSHDDEFCVDRYKLHINVCALLFYPQVVGDAF